MKKGYCGIGIYQPKFQENLGMLFRSAAAFGADFIFTIGKKYSGHKTNTCKAENNLPLFYFDSVEQLKNSIYKNSELIAVEISESAFNIKNYVHPKRAIYLLGNEAFGIPEEELKKCNQIVKLNTSICLNVAVTGSIILFDRFNKL